MSGLQGFDDTSDGEDRVADFLARHGGASPRRSAGETRNAGLAGTSQVYAADGYTLLCEWSHTGSQKELKFTEIPPKTGEHARGALEN